MEIRSHTTHRKVRFEYCISFVAFTWRVESEVIELKSGQSAVIASLPYCMISLVLGWWGAPWGILLTPVTIWHNLRGGRRIEQESAHLESNL